MKTTKTNKVALNDQNLTGRKAKHVKGGPIYMNVASISGYSSQASNTYVAPPSPALNFLKQ